MEKKDKWMFPQALGPPLPSQPGDGKVGSTPQWLSWTPSQGPLQKPVLPVGRRCAFFWPSGADGLQARWEWAPTLCTTFPYNLESLCGGFCSVGCMQGLFREQPPAYRSQSACETKSHLRLPAPSGTLAGPAPLEEGGLGRVAVRHLSQPGKTF